MRPNLYAPFEAGPRHPLQGLTAQVHGSFEVYAICCGPED